MLLLCEGTYPYISGGVSSWVHTLISGLKEFTFGIIFLGASKEIYGDIKYKIPENVRFVKAYYMFESSELPSPKERRINKKLMEEIKSLIYWFKGKQFGKWSAERIYNLLERVKLEDFLYSREGWDFITEEYLKNADDVPFVDYFWTHRNMHIPVWKVHELVRDIDINFGLLHSPSTGYAGLLGVFLKSKIGKPFVIHEHGIYVRERKLDISMADWIKDVRGLQRLNYWEDSYLKKLWTNFFLGINRLVYHQADLILSLFEGARQIQIELGAPPEKTQVLPNGINLDDFRKALELRGDSIPPVVAMIGRVVPIKDIRTFVRACKVFLELMPNGECWVVGPEDEDSEYAQSCKELAKALGIGEKVKFLGLQRVTEILPKVGIVTLTSISEGMPLSVLEAFAAGVPVVATDVGAVRELIEGGLDEKDRGLEVAGIVVPPGDDKAIGKAFFELLSDEEFYRKAQKSALERVGRFYSLELFLENYRNVYKRFLGWRG